MSPHDQLEDAAAQLRCAAAIAEHRAQGNPLDPWSAMAGTIRLIAASLDPMPAALVMRVLDLQDHLEAALAALERIPASDAPTDFAFWHAHVADLGTNAHMLDARTPGTNSSRS